MNRILPFVLAATCTSTALAGQIERAWVDPDASWMVHIDFEGLMHSQLFQGVAANAGVNLRDVEQHIRSEIHEELAGQSDIPPHVLETWHNMNFSFLEDMKSVTIFGTDGNQEPAAVILQTTDAIDQIVATLEPIKGINVAHGENMSFVALREPGAAQGAGEGDHVAAIRKNPITNDRTIIITDTTAKLIDELNLFAKQAAAGPNSGPPWTVGRPGTCFLVHVSQEGLGHLNEDASRILGLAKQIHLEAGENAGEVFADATLQAKDPDTVNNVVALANGVMAMGRLTLASEPEGKQIIDLLNAVRITSQGSSVSAEFRMPTDTLIDTLKKLDDEHDGADQPQTEQGDQDHDVKVKVESE